MNMKLAHLTLKTQIFTEDNGCQVAAIPHMTVATFIRVVYLICIAQLNDSFQGVGASVVFEDPTLIVRCRTAIKVLVKIPIESVQKI
jgi:hypothetical protein